jgi:uracil-DNA glycosylase
VPQLGLFEPPPKNLTWKDALHDEREKDYFKKLVAFIDGERAAGKTIYPQSSDVFNSMHYTQLEEVRVVIIGQDPYHGPNQAHGLCFSVKPGIEPPPSLKNIFKELESDLAIPHPTHGNLEKWAKQGVLLLNAVLTVEAGKPGSHANLGWESFTDRVIKELNDRKEGLIFLLWGAYAQKKGQFINTVRQHVFQAPHPSPFSAHNGFFGCRHFSKTNAILRKRGLKEIDWSL